MTNLFCIYYFQKINLLIHSNNLSIVFFISLPTKREIYNLQYLFTQFRYGDRTIIAIIICDVRRRVRHLFITFAVVLDISSSLSRLLSIIRSTRNKRYNTFWANKLWLYLTVKYSFVFKRFTRVCRFSC
jgi:hypothetical protein